MAVKLKVENNSADFDSDLNASLALVLNNTGDVDCAIHFDESGAAFVLPAKSSIEFPFVGDRYSGKVYGQFAAVASDDTTSVKQVTIIKTLHFCN